MRVHLIDDLLRNSDWDVIFITSCLCHSQICSFSSVSSSANDLLSPFCTHFPPQHSSKQTPSLIISCIHRSFFTVILIVQVPSSFSQTMAIASQLLSLFLLVFLSLPYAISTQQLGWCSQDTNLTVSYPCWRPFCEFLCDTLAWPPRHDLTSAPTPTALHCSTFQALPPSPCLNLADLHPFPQVGQDPADSRSSFMLPFLSGTT